MPTANKKISPKIISLTILIAFIPLYGYFAAYIYEMGFCVQFQIPIDLIEIGLTETLKIMAFIIPLVILIFCAWIMTLFTKMFKNPILRILGTIIFPSSLVILGVILFRENLITAIIIILVGWFIMSGSDLIFPFFRGWKINGYKKRLEISEKYEASVKNPLDWIVDSVMDQIGVLTYVILFIFLIALAFFVHPLGESNAKKQISFLVIKSKPELVILRKYSHNFICAPLNREKKVVRKNFIIKSVNRVAEEGHQIVLEDIGPLKVFEEKTISPQDLKEILNIITTSIQLLAYL